MNCLCNNSILPLIILMSCCGEGTGGILGFGGRSGGNGLDDLLWLLCILCLCGGNSFSSDSRRC